MNKETPTIEFTFESGAEFVYDGTGEAPNIGATVLEEGVEFNTYFEKDEVNIGTSIPTEPGTYSFIVETVENDQYVSPKVMVGSNKVGLLIMNQRNPLAETY